LAADRSTGVHSRNANESAAGARANAPGATVIENRDPDSTGAGRARVGAASKRTANTGRSRPGISCSDSTRSRSAYRGLRHALGTGGTNICQRPLSAPLRPCALPKAFSRASQIDEAFGEIGHHQSRSGSPGTTALHRRVVGGHLHSLFWLEAASGARRSRRFRNHEPATRPNAVHFDVDRIWPF
jgi:hypothetical protein